MASGVLRGPLRALGSPRFATYWGAQALSAVADRAYLVAFTVQLAVVESRPGLLALSLAVNALCFTLPMPFAGALIDRVGTRPVLLAADLTRFVGTFLLAAAFSRGDVPDGLWVATAAIVGLGESMFWPGFTAAIPTLAGTERLASANSLRQVAHFTGSLTGPVIVGVLVANNHMSWAFWAQAVTFLIAAAAAVVVPRHVGHGAPQETQHLLRSVLAGLRFVFRQSWIVLIITFMFLENLFTEGSRFVLLPLHASSASGLDLGTAGFAWLAAASGIGALAGSLYFGRRERGSGERVRTFVGSLLVCGIGWTLLGTDVTPLAFTGMALSGFGIAGESIVGYSAVQARVEGGLLGRTSAALDTVVYLSGPISYAAAYAIQGHVDPGTAIIGCGLAIVASGLVAASGVLRPLDE
jgi:MFS family permease